MTKIFLSYRRQDTKAIAGRIFDRLEAKFGRDAVFMDIDSIPPGVDFHDWLDEQVGRAEIVLALIGHGWSDARDESGNRRLDSANDFVRIELEAAIARRIPLVPVLIDGAPFPRADELADSLKPLTRRHAAFVDAGRDFNVHMARLIEALERHLAGGWSAPPTLPAKPAAPALRYEDKAARLVRSFTGHDGEVFSVAFSQDGRFALSGSADETLTLWDLGASKAPRSFTGHTGWVHSVAFSPDGRFALSGSGDNTLKLWDVGTAKVLLSFERHWALVYSVAFSPDGRFAISGSEDKTIILWDVGTAKELRSFGGHTDWVRSVAFSPDGRFALSGSADDA